MILLLITTAFAEPFRATATVTGGQSAGVPELNLSADYGVFHHLSVVGEFGIRTDTGHHLGAGIVLLPFDGRWGRLGVTLIPEMEDPFTAEPRMCGRVGLRGNWLAFWGVGLSGRGDVVLSADRAPELDWGLGFSLRM